MADNGHHCQPLPLATTHTTTDKPQLATRESETKGRLKLKLSLPDSYLFAACTKGEKWCWFTSVYNFLHSRSIFSHKYWSNLQHFPIPLQFSIVSLLESRSALSLFALDNIIVCCLLFCVSPSISAFCVNIQSAGKWMILVPRVSAAGEGQHSAN